MGGCMRVGYLIGDVHPVARSGVIRVRHPRDRSLPDVMLWVEIYFFVTTTICRALAGKFFGIADLNGLQDTG